MITVIRENRRREDLGGLLDLHRQTIEVGDGYWVTFRVYQVPKSDGRPSGVTYALTLHRPDGERILGYDNAHVLKLRRSPSRRSRTPTEYDHVHRGVKGHDEKITPYVYENAGKLLEDFWTDVEALLRERGVR